MASCLKRAPHLVLAAAPSREHAGLLEGQAHGEPRALRMHVQSALVRHHQVPADEPAAIGGALHAHLQRSALHALLQCSALHALLQCSALHAHLQCSWGLHLRVHNFFQILSA